MALAAPQILQCTDVVKQGLEVSEYVDEDARLGWARDAHPLVGGREDTLATGSNPLSSGSSKMQKDGYVHAVA